MPTGNTSFALTIEESLPYFHHVHFGHLLPAHQPLPQRADAVVTDFLVVVGQLLGQCHVCVTHQGMHRGNTGAGINENHTRSMCSRSNALEWGVLCLPSAILLGGLSPASAL